MCRAGRSDVEGVKALAVAAQRCFADYRPGGMRVIAGSVILEPGLKRTDFDELKQQGRVAGESRLRRGQDRLRLRAAGRRRQGGGPDHDLPHRRLVDPRLGRHHRRSPARRCTRTSRFTSMAGRPPCRTRTSSASSAKSDIALQVCTAGNLRTTLLCARLADKHDAFDRFIIATDTPTGSGIMPLGMLYTIAHLASLTDMPPERFICAATGSNARVYGLDSGYLAPGKAADIVLIDAPDGGTQTTALAAIKHGDIAAIGGVITAGIPRFVGRSRNTPATTRKARVAVSRVHAGFRRRGPLALSSTRVEDTGIAIARQNALVNPHRRGGSDAASR